MTAGVAAGVSTGVASGGAILKVGRMSFIVLPTVESYQRLYTGFK